MTSRQEVPLTTEQIIARGERASKIIGDEVFVDAVQQADALFTQEWKSATDTARREAAWAKSAALDEVVRVLRSIMDNGKVATARVKRGSR